MREKNIVVIGGGPGGYVAAIKAAQAGASVTLIEKDKMGGTCTNRGCIPTKALLETSNLLSSIKEAEQYGISVNDVFINYSKVLERKNRVVKQLMSGVEFLMKKNNIKVIKGTGKIIDSKKVEITGNYEKIEADNIIIATGSVPVNIPIEGGDGRDVINSNDVLDMEILPKSVVIIGGGYIGIEFAQFLNDMGCKSTIVEMLPQILPTLDSEIAEMFEDQLRGRGVEIFTDAKVMSIKDTKKGKKVIFETKEGQKAKQADKVIIAVGRKPEVKDLGVEGIGIMLNKGRIMVNERMETNVSGVYAIGDVVGGIMLAHVAMAEAECAVDNIFDVTTEIDYRAVPKCIYTSPEIASVGMDEVEAMKKYNEVKVARFPYIANGRAVILNETNGEIKLIADSKYGEILGVHIIGPYATELIAEAVLAIKMEATVEEVSKTIHAHPTVSEAMAEVAFGIQKKTIHI